MFFADAGNSRIGINTGAPSEALHVVGGSRITTGLTIGVMATYGDHLLMLASTTTPAMKIGNNAYNLAESGRIIFEESTTGFPTVGAFCGFNFKHDGSADKLHLISGCPSELNIMTWERNGEIGVGTIAPTASLSVNGIANKPGGGDWAVFSDRRLKKDVTDYNEGLDLIMKVHPVNFTYNEKYFALFGAGTTGLTTKVYQGVIAQELQEISPDMVRTVNSQENNSSDADGGTPAPKGGEFLEVDPSKFTYALINSVQQQQQQIEAQQKEIENLKLMVQQLIDK